MKVQVIVAAIWLTVHSKQLKMYEKAMLCNGEELNNRIINAAQKILYYQFPSLQGLHSTWLSLITITASLLLLVLLSLSAVADKADTLTMGRSSAAEILINFQSFSTYFFSP